MKKILFTIIGLWLTFPTLAQQRIEGRLTDERGTPVPFAAVYWEKGTGTTSNQQGEFTLILPEEMPENIIIQSIGFNTDTIETPRSSNFVEYQLKYKQYNINEVAIRNEYNISHTSNTSTLTTSKKEIEFMRPKNITEALQSQPGFTNKSGYQAPINLRGFSGKHLLVLRNGMKRFSSYPGGFMSHLVNVYDLEKIEVEKGASSVKYGSGAMAGTINLIDKSPFKHKGFDAKISSGFASNNNEYNLLACGGWSDGKLAIKGGGRIRSANNFRYPDGSEATNSYYSDKDFLLTTGYRFSNTHYLTLLAEIHNGGPWGKPVGFNGTQYMHVYTENETSNNLMLKYHFNDLKLNLYFSNESRAMIKDFFTAAGYQLSFTETTNFSDHYYGVNASHDLEIGEQHTLTSGAEYFKFYISTPTNSTDYIQNFSYNNRVCTHANSALAALYLQEEFTLSNTIKFIGGLRYNYAIIEEGESFNVNLDRSRTNEKHALSGTLGGRFIIGKKALLKLNLARSFRMPDVTELYTENYTSNGILYGNPDLQAEYCNSLDINFQYKSNSIDFEVSPFVWLMKNLIGKEEIRGYSGTNYIYINIGNTRMTGTEIGLRLKADQWLKNKHQLSLRAGLSWLHGTDVSDNQSFFRKGKPLDYVPPLNIKTELKYHHTHNENVEINSSIETIYYTEQNRFGDNPYVTPAYLIFGFRTGIQLLKWKSKPTINIAINNLLNSEYFPYQSYLPAEGRDMRIYLSFSL